MLYEFLRPTVRLCLQFYCKRLSFEGVENIPIDKPVLFCSSHSNSFLDALFLCVCLNRPVYPLARGDAFRKPLMAKILWEFKMLPIFRQSEGEADASAKNETSFQRCQQLFRENKQVLIYPEGICKHQREILPLKKGAAVMVQRAWTEGIDLWVIPVGISYDDYFKWGKKCDVVFGKAIQGVDFQDVEAASFAKVFNEKLLEAMKNVFPSPYRLENGRLYNGILSQLIYYLGWLINAPHYIFCYWLGKKLTKGTIFHDSAVLGLTAVLLPFYYLTLLFIFIILL
jgi:1-acyl-sn-glycerol-3-phosphate acyltransferase